MIDFFDQTQRFAKKKLFDNPFVSCLCVLKSKTALFPNRKGALKGPKKPHFSPSKHPCYVASTTLTNQEPLLIVPWSFPEIASWLE